MAADPHSAEFFAQALNYTPSGILGSFTGSAADKKVALTRTPGILKALVDAFAADQTAAQWSLATLYDLLRSDSSCFNLFEGNLSTLGIYKTTLTTLQASKNEFIADKVAWILSGVIGNCSTDFSESEVKCFLDALRSCSEQGKLDAAVNVLKAGAFKKCVLSYPSFVDMDFNAQTTAPAIIYKKMFILWLVSFESGALPFKAETIVHKLKEVLTYSRVEKVVRLSLTCIQSLLSSKIVADEIVEQGLLETVQSLEFEKWRDSELYDEIRSISSAISTRVAEMSNFARYERELSAGRLKWGFIHSPKFWSENVLKFEQNDWKALKALRACLDLQGDSTTVAVACHDLGEFVTAHPLGKRQVTALGVKDKVMQLMSSSSGDKEVKREALLCCQKIMLNKWQDVDTSA